LRPKDPGIAPDVVRPCLTTGEEISGTEFSFFDLADGRISRYRVWLRAMFEETVVFDSSQPALAGD